MTAATLQRLRPNPASEVPTDLDRVLAARQRQQRHRERLREGRIVLDIEVDEVALTEKLAETGYLGHHDDRAALRMALEKMLADLVVVTSHA